jgi:hypothetical protein
LIEAAKVEAERKAQEEHEARIRSEREAEELRKELKATEDALQVERRKGFFARLFGK